MLYAIHTYIHMFVPYDATLSKQNNTLQMHITSVCLLLLITYHCFCKKTFSYFGEIRKYSNIQ